jgi:hypothetical protein
MMDCYYQLFLTQADHEVVIEKMTRAGVKFFNIRSGYLRDFFAMQFDIDHFTDFNYLMSEIFGELNIKYLLFADIDFKRIIEFSDRLGIIIVDISVARIDSDIVRTCESELEMYISCGDRNSILQSIHDNELHIKNMSLIYNDLITIKIYDSGIIKTNVDLAQSKPLQDLLKAILKITRGVFDDDLSQS